jgi:uncharacterized membrane protein
MTENFLSPREARIAGIINAIVERGARHWLALLGGGLALWNAQLYLAPALRAGGHSALAKPVYAYNGFFCHQRADRSFFPFGEKMACCERCAAIYGALLAFALLFAFLGLRLPVPRWRTLVLFALPIALDGGSQLFGWRESTPGLRVVTGAWFGFGLGWLMLTVLETSFRNVKETEAERPGPLRSTPSERG